jgi:hypothetical protein
VLDTQTDVTWHYSVKARADSNVEARFVNDRGESLESIGVIDRLQSYRQVTLFQLRGLIATFQEVEEYGPRRHGNRMPPPLWVGDDNYLQDVKSLLHELRRLNDLLEGAADAAKIEKTGSMVASLAEKVCHSAADVIGKGLGAVILGSVGMILIELGVGDVAKVLSGAIKGGN